MLWYILFYDWFHNEVTNNSPIITLPNPSSIPHSSIQADSSMIASKICTAANSFLHRKLTSKFDTVNGEVRESIKHHKFNYYCQYLPLHYDSNCCWRRLS